MYSPPGSVHQAVAGGQVYFWSLGFNSGSFESTCSKTFELNLSDLSCDIGDGELK